MPAKKKTTRKKKASTAIKKDEPLFVGLSEPDNLRKHLLESSKEALLVLTKVEKIKDIRDQKLESADVLASLLVDIKSLIVKLKKKIPTGVTKHIHDKKVEGSPATVEPTPIPKKSKKPAPMSELDKLEAELAMIEKKLAR